MDYQTTVSVNENEKKETKKKTKQTPVFNQKPTSAFIGASWFALGTGIISYCIGLWNANMLLNEKGYYFTVLLFALFSVISVQKSVRDKLEGVDVTDIYYRMSWFTSIISILLLIIGLRNADLELSEKGFYGMSFLLSVFSAIAVQKNTRDINYIEKRQNEDEK